MESIGNSAESVAQAFIRAINRQDVDRLTALMSPTHRFIDSLGNVIEGREKMREGWAAYFRIVPDYSIAIEETYPGEPVVVLLGLAEGTYTRDGKLSPETGVPADRSSSTGCKNRWKTPVAIRALVEDGLVAEWRVYADNEPIRKAMAAG
jgi:hypothetical protein